MSELIKASRRLKEDQRNEIKDFLLQNSTGMNVNRGAVKDAACKWGVDKKTVSSIWKRAKECVANGKVINVSARYGGNLAPKMAVNMAKVKVMPHDSRRTIRQFAENYGTSKSTVHRWMDKGHLRQGTSHLHPLLRDAHKLARLKFSLESVAVSNDGSFKIKDMSRTVHIDEKWFYMTKINQKYILLPDEEVPYKACQSKQHIIKLMFMCAVAMPVFGDDGKVLFDEKIGIFPFAEKVPAQRSSVNRRETLETKAIPKINREEMKKCLLNHVIPAIKTKWPSFLSKETRIQQDNARPHISNEDVQFREAATSDGFNIVMVNQPAQSPDTNINDLGFFNSIQSLQQKMRTINPDELIKAVKSAFDVLEARTINKVFLSLQGCLIQIMKRRGNNDYKIPHMGKDHLIAIGQLPIDLEVDKNLVKDCVEYLHQMGEQINNPILMEALGY